MKSGKAILALGKAQKTWPYAVIRKARKAGHCDNPFCHQSINPGMEYIDPGESNPYKASGFGGYRYCLICAGRSLD